jgi:hypothetical protein
VAGRNACCETLLLLPLLLPPLGLLRARVALAGAPVGQHAAVFALAVALTTVTLACSGCARSGERGRLLHRWQRAGSSSCLHRIDGAHLNLVAELDLQ